MKIARTWHVHRLRDLLRRYPVVALLGARQVGKTWLARQIVAAEKGPTHYFDLEDPADHQLFVEPALALRQFEGLVVLDEIQRFPGLFPVLRVLADRPGSPARFLVLGSASPELLRHGAETLAGRIAFHELPGFDFQEAGEGSLQRLWLRGGFPMSFLSRTDTQSLEWRKFFVRTFLERDVPALGIALPPEAMWRFWTMLAHYHGQTFNASELARSFGISHTTVQRYLDILTGAFVITQLRPWAENVGKRVVKAPKIYVTDSGLFHALMDVRSLDALRVHPKLGASWEGLLLHQVLQQLSIRREERFFWATHGGAELDLLVLQQGHRVGFEFKRTELPRVTASMRVALETLRLDRLLLVHAGSRSFDLEPAVRAVAASSLVRELRQIAS